MSSDRALIISSDGHAMPAMRAYREYLPVRLHESFDEFCDFYDEHCHPPMSPAHLRGRLDDDVVEQWVRDVVEPGRLEGSSDPRRRLEELEREGVVAEVVFPDFGLPFEAFGPPSQKMREAAAAGGRVGWPQRTQEQIDEGNKAHNRWLADFVATAPDRFCAMAVVSFHDVDATLAELRWARDHGLRGLLLPTFSPEMPLFHPRHDPIWALLEELGMPVNSHIAISSTLPRTAYQGIPDPRVALPLQSKAMMFNCHEVLNHFLWSGILERHPGLNVAFTEQGSYWIVNSLRSADFSFDGSYLRSDVREFVKHRPSEIFRRQCWLGSSIFSEAEIRARHEIGLEQMLLGMDYPHHEGTLAMGGTVEYLRATLGAAGVPRDEAAQLLGGNAIAKWGFDESVLRPIAERVGPELDHLLTPPTEDLFPRGDVHKPLIVV